MKKISLMIIIFFIQISIINSYYIEKRNKVSKNEISNQSAENLDKHINNELIIELCPPVSSFDITFSQLIIHKKDTSLIFAMYDMLNTDGNVTLWQTHMEHFKNIIDTVTHQKNIDNKVQKYSIYSKVELSDSAYDVLNSSITNNTLINDINFIIIIINGTIYKSERISAEYTFEDATLKSKIIVKIDSLKPNKALQEFYSD